MMNEKIQEKLLELGKKNKELTEEYKKEDRKRKKCLNEALKGFNILREVVQMPQIATYSMFYEIELEYRDRHGSVSHMIYIDGAKIHYEPSLHMFPSNVLDKNNAEDVMSAWSTKYAGSSQRGLLDALREISKLGKDKLLERILDDLLG